ncbi:MAG: hypothetical protein CVU43_08550 [Chloroflexi bacterium HGW-Chloroflexi-5]|jgi:hypothetical protein|nr:MAG: hypothetical protein CVU43_08550 [Chloroflexi bacterium HGW-Chloroflexi-5]
MDIASNFLFEESITTLFEEVKRGVIETLPYAEADRRRQILLMLSMMQEVRESIISNSSKGSGTKRPNIGKNLRIIDA